MTEQYQAGLTAEIIYKRFTDRFKVLADEIMSDVITSYLPHAESDLDSNVYYRSMDYIAGQFKEDTIYGDMGKRFRQRIFEENKEMIINQLNQDNLEIIEQLKADVESWKASYYDCRGRSNVSQS